MAKIKFGNVTNPKSVSYGIMPENTPADKYDIELTHEQMATLGKTHKLDYATKSYVEMTEEDFAKIADKKAKEAKKRQDISCKTKLASNDYKTVKILPKVLRELITKGVLEESETILEYLALDDEQQILRDQINSLGECF